MTILDSKQRVTFVTEKETVKQLEELIILQRCNGRKVTMSSLIDEILRAHVDTAAIDQLFAAGK